MYSVYILFLSIESLQSRSTRRHKHSAKSPGDDHRYFLRRTLTTKNNIIHISVQQEQEDFVTKSLQRFPHLASQKNSAGETPFHLVAATENVGILKLLFDAACKEEEEYEQTPPNVGRRRSSKVCRPWKVKDSKGNTPLHVALVYGKVEFAAVLLKRDSEVAGYVNKSGETLLHLAVKHYVNDDKRSTLHAMKQVTSIVGANVKVRCTQQTSDNIIKLLLETNSNAACLRDSNGFTPLLIAASLTRPYVSAIKSIIHHCPQSLQVCDPLGKNMLHLMNELSDIEDGECLFSIREIHSLKNHPDSEGNTPAHIAVKNHNVSMVVFLLQLSANFALKNRQGISATNMLQQSDGLRDLLNAKGSDALWVPCRMMDGEMERLEKLLLNFVNWDNLNSHLPPQQHWTVDKIKRKFFSHDGGNIVHGVLEMKSPLYLYYEKEEIIYKFIEEAIDRCPSRICETNRSGDTPLHILMREDPSAVYGSLLEKYRGYFEKLEEESRGLYFPPWRMKNKDGNTPLHVAMLSGRAKVRCLVEFLRFDPGLAICHNNDMETPLHLLCRGKYSHCGKVFDHFGISCNSINECLCIRNRYLCSDIRDKDNLTPLLKAAKQKNVMLAGVLYNICAGAAISATTDDGQTFWHLLASQPHSNTGRSDYDDGMCMDGILRSCFDGREFDDKRLRHIPPPQHFEYYESDPFKNVCMAADKEGNTALHVALEKGNYQFAQFFIQYSQHQRGLYWEIMTTRNNRGLTPADMIGSAEYIPHEFENFLWTNPELMEDILGHRSFSGLSTAMLKDYSSTIGVVAALLATITFTAAFAVPGGLNSDKGTPIFMQNAAFQAFMASDIIAMCLSMMVLFCLLWIMTMNNKKESVVLLDITIILLRLSFYATLVAFMTGLYVTTFEAKPWIAIFSCVVCSSLILVMHKSFFTFCMPGFVRMFALYWRATYSVRKAPSSVRDLLGM